MIQQVNEDHQGQSQSPKQFKCFRFISYPMDGWKMLKDMLSYWTKPTKHQVESHAEVMTGGSSEVEQIAELLTLVSAKKKGAGAAGLKCGNWQAPWKISPKISMCIFKTCQTTKAFNKVFWIMHMTFFVDSLFVAITAAKLIESIHQSNLLCPTFLTTPIFREPQALQNR